MSYFLERGTNRFNYFQASCRRNFGRRAVGRILDFGCGEGKFLFAALRAGHEAYGVEVDPGRQKEFMHNAERFNPAAAEHFRLYDGRLLPFASNWFDACHSYFVFEHVTDPQTSLREIARVLKPGGTVSIFADDVRNAWDGHAQVPWPPYMPREFAAAYLEGLGKGQHAQFVTSSVVYVSAPAIADILSTLGFEIVYATPPPQGRGVPDGLYVTSEDEARVLGERVARAGGFQSPAENLTLLARKL